jgi:AraC family transcriptional activator of pobA
MDMVASLMKNFCSETLSEKYIIGLFSQITLLELSDPERNDFESLFQKILRDQQSSYVNRSELLFVYLLECIHNAMKLNPKTVKRERSTQSVLCESFQDLLSQQFPIISPEQRLELRTPQEFAQKLNVHINYLNRVLKKQFGMTTTKIITDRVIREAKSLLLHTDLSIGEIGYSLGFEEPTHFSYFFHKHAGMVPTAQRQV